MLLSVLQCWWGKSIKSTKKHSPDQLCWKTESRAFQQDMYTSGQGYSTPLQCHNSKALGVQITTWCRLIGTSYSLLLGLSQTKYSYTFHMHLTRMWVMWHLNHVLYHGTLHKFVSEMAFVNTFGTLFVCCYSCDLTVCTLGTHGTHPSMLACTFTSVQWDDECRI